MGKKIKKLLCFGLIAVLLLGLNGQTLTVYGETENEREEGQSAEQAQGLVEAPSAVLMEAGTGTVIFEKDAHERRSPASITKIMTLILIFDAIENGTLKMTDSVTTSAYAKSMGGSQVFLEEGEVQDVETMIKCIVIASGNDASVAMAEHIAGSEPEFVRRMNERAAGLGMEDTNFVDCCGLTESTDHYTTAYDIALMSRELITHYPKILEYSSIWMEDITHVTRQGSKEFTLTNTNKLIRSYDGCVGLKTGSTSIAKYCLSAVAKRNGITLISVVMAAPDYKVRFRDAAAMLNYGFSKCSLYEDRKPMQLPVIAVERGKKEQVSVKYEKIFRYLSTEGEALDNVERKLEIKDTVQAPVKKGECAGEMHYYANGKEIGSVRVIYGESVERATYPDCIRRVLEQAF